VIPLVVSVIGTQEYGKIHIDAFKNLIQASAIIREIISFKNLLIRCFVLPGTRKKVHPVSFFLEFDDKAVDQAA
jgi:hypothetical protein